MSAKRILLVDDDDNFRTKVRNTLGRVYFVTEASSEADFRREFRPYTFDLIILDMRLESDREGLRLLGEILSYDDLQPVIMVSAYGDTDAVLDSAEIGALMFLHKQEFTAELLARMVEAVLQQAHVRRSLAALQSRLPCRDTIALAGRHPAVRRATELIQRAANDNRSIVLLIGERGTGRELAAELIHDQSSSRSDGPFLTENILAMRLEDSRKTLFGVPGQGGIPRRKGLLEQANGGVLFIDQIEALDVETRSSLREMLRKRWLSCHPDCPPIPLDLQLVAGTDPEGNKMVASELQEAAAGERLIEIYLPPLRERREDLALLAAIVLQDLRRAGRTSARTLSGDAVSALEVHYWPGNLPEFRNAVEFGAIKALLDGSEEITVEHLPANFAQDIAAKPSGGSWNYRYYLAHAEVALMERALEEKGALNKTRLAEMLGYTDRFALSRRIRTALKGFPDIAREFPKVSGMFR